MDLFGIQNLDRIISRIPDWGVKMDNMIRWVGGMGVFPEVEYVGLGGENHIISTGPITQIL